MVSALDSGASGLGSSPGRGHCVVYKWVPENLMLGSNPAMNQHSIRRGVEILLVASYYRNRDKLRPDGPLGSCTDLIYY